MASEIRVNKIENRSGLGTVTFADTGVDLAGIVTATTFSGSGASLTSLPAAQVTGTLPAISGANLTNLAAANLTGTIADARFPATLPAASAANLTNVPAANITGTLPALTAANLTNIPAGNIVGLATAGFNRSGGFPEGVTTAYQFRLTSGLSCGNSYTDLSANWEKVDSGGQGNLGTFADPSSGIFTFPSTGIYLVRFNGYFEDSGDSPICEIRIQATTDNSSYSSVASTIDSMGNLDTYTYANVNVETLIDVTDTSNVKVYFEGKSKNTSTLDGSSSENRTYVTFIRLGDT